MSEQTIRVSRSVDVPAAMPWLVAIAVYLLLMVLGSRLLADADTYGTLRSAASFSNTTRCRPVRRFRKHCAAPTGSPTSGCRKSPTRPRTSWAAGSRSRR
jgi:hypothetical protein